MRMQSGITDQVIYFVAVDATDLKTREPGLSAFTVYRSRNGGAATAYTTPTITEVDATNMPGVYKFLLDEDMTIDAGDDSQEMCFHITCSGMAPVTRTIELYRATVTAGQTLTVTSGGVTLADGVSHGGTLGSGTATLALSRLSVVSQSANTSAVTATGNGTGHGIAASSGSGATGNGINATSAATNGNGLATTGNGTGNGILTTGGAGAGGDGLEAAAGGGVPIRGDQTGNITGNLSGSVGSVTGAVGSVTGAVGSVTGSVGGNVTGSVGSVAAGGITASSFAADAITAAKVAADVGTEIGTAVWATAARTLTAGTNIQLPSNGLANITAWTVDITGSLSGSVGSVTGAVGSVTGLTASDVGAIKTVTDKFSFTVANMVDANIQYVNDVQVTGNGQAGTEWGP